MLHEFRERIEPELGSQVYVNIYDINVVTQLLNWLVLRGREMGIFHCGVEVHGFEVSFVLLTDESEAGVVASTPKGLSKSYKFSESIDVGWTEFSLEKTKQIITDLSVEWDAYPYHITRHNCLLFAEALVDKLGPSKQFPQWLRNLCTVMMRNPGLASIVDASWEIAKWHMLAREGILRWKTLNCCTTDGSAGTTGRNCCTTERCCTAGDSCKPCFTYCTTDKDCKPFNYCTIDGYCTIGGDCKPCNCRTGDDSSQPLQAFSDEHTAKSREGELNEQANTLTVSNVVQDLVTGDLNQPASFRDLVTGDMNRPASFCESNSSDRWNKHNEHRTEFCGFGRCDLDSYCIVHKFTRVDVGKAEVCFEVVQTSADKLAEDPAISTLSWDGGFSLPTLKKSVEINTYQLCTTLRGVLLYEGIPDTLLEGQGDLWFQYGLSGSGSRPIKVCRKKHGASRSNYPEPKSTVFV